MSKPTYQLWLKQIIESDELDNLIEDINNELQKKQDKINPRPPLTIDENQNLDLNVTDKFKLSDGVLDLSEQAFAINQDGNWQFTAENYMSMNHQQIAVVKDPTSPQDVATKNYVDNNKIATSIELLPNESGRNNADLTKTDTGYALRVWDPQFEGSKEVADFGIIESQVAGVEVTDDTLGTTAYIDKFYQQKKDIISPWIDGEYKYMPIGSTMPDGWIKIIFDDDRINLMLMSNMTDMKQEQHKGGTSVDSVLIYESNVIKGFGNLVLTDMSNVTHIATFMGCDLWQYKPNLKETTA